MQNNQPDEQQQPFGMWNRTANEQPLPTFVDQVKTKAQEQIDDLKKNKVVIDINSKLDGIKEDLKTEYQNLDSKAQQMLSGQKDKMNAWIKKKMEVAILLILDKVKPHLRDSLKDPYMCEYVSDLVDDVFEETWPDIRDQILFQIRLKYADPYELIEFKQPSLNCVQYPWYWFKKWYLYTYLPFDKSIWKQFRGISWWFIFIIKLIPFYGIQSFVFCVVFLLIDKKDEYQLIIFILRFKSMQFITLGIIGTMVGYFTFYSCAVVSKLDEDYETCRNDGPAIFLNFWTDIVGFLLQLILVWIAFILLPFSESKGKVRFKNLINKEEKPKQSQCCCFYLFTQRGGRLKCFMIFDFICCLGCIGLFLGLAFSQNDRQLWQYKSIMYLCKTCYGICSFPFLLFLIPGIRWVLTRSHGTGYDEFGVCVPLVSDLELYHKRNKQNGRLYDEKYLKQDSTIDIFEQQQLMEEIIL